MIPCPECSKGFSWPRLRKSGDDAHGAYICPRCMKLFYQHSDGKISSKKPFKWPGVTKKDFGVIWTPEKGWSANFI